MTTKMLAIGRTAEKIGACTRTVDRHLDNPILQFPRPVVVNGRRYWYEHEIDQWLNTRVRDSELAAAS